MSKLTIEKWKLPAPPDKFVDNRLVNLLGDPDDYHCVLLASLGMSYKVISQQTGLSFGQIAYRLRRANHGRENGKRLSAANYRNGSSDTAKEVVSLASKRVSRLIIPELRQTLAIDV